MIGSRSTADRARTLEWLSDTTKDRFQAYSCEIDGVHVSCDDGTRRQENDYAS